MCPSWSCRLAFIVPLALAACNPSEMPDSEVSTQSETAPQTTEAPGSTTLACEIGMLGCPCPGGGACDPGLMCTAEKICGSGQDVTTGSETTAMPMTDGTSTGADDTTTGSTGPVGPECTPTGDQLESAECLAIDPNQPFCEVDTCVGCGALQADTCTDASDGGRPICLPDGRCVQCDTSDALNLAQCEADKPHCNLETNTCEGCFEHSECPETACEIAARKCFPSNLIIYVRQGPTPGSPCTYTPGMGGNMDVPYCDFATATLSAQLNGFFTGYTFHLMGNDDAEGDPGAVVIAGGGVPVAYAFTHDLGAPLDKHTRFKGPGPLILVPKNVTLYLRDWGIIIDKPTGDRHSSPVVWIKYSPASHDHGIVPAWSAVCMPSKSNPNPSPTWMSASPNFAGIEGFAPTLSSFTHINAKTGPSKTIKIAFTDWKSSGSIVQSNAAMWRC